jgi:REP element-mobilizing transposase RayT
MPVGDDTVAYRRRMPHLLKRGKNYFVTFRTRKRLILPPSARDVVLATCVELHRKSCWIHCVVVMPDHVHLIVKPFDTTALAPLMKKVKGGSSYRANKVLGTTGPIWQHESFDHILRRDEDLQKKVEYVWANPVRAGLVRVSAEYRWLWRAIDEEPAG